MHTNKSLNASHAEVNVQLYGGDIHLLGGSHFLMKDHNESTAGRVQAEGDETGANKFSQASTAAGSDLLPYSKMTGGGQLNR